VGPYGRPGGAQQVGDQTPAPRPRWPSVGPARVDSPGEVGTSQRASDRTEVAVREGGRSAWHPESRKKRGTLSRFGRLTPIVPPAPPGDVHSSLRLTDAQRRRLGVRAKALGRRVLTAVACIVTPDTPLRRYRIASCINSAAVAARRRASAHSRGCDEFWCCRRRGCGGTGGTRRRIRPSRRSALA
jgi:hypothetical protein